MQIEKLCEKCGKLATFDPYFKDYVCGTCGNIERIKDIPLKMRGFELISNLPDGIKKNCKLPSRSTASSAGYDFYCPCDVELKPGEQEIIWTGVKAYMQPDEVLLIFNRSSLGIKKGLQLPNSVGVIDSDYYNNPDNEGEICVCLKNCSEETVYLKTGEKIAQGIFINYLKADNDNTTSERTGGIGSTGA